MRGLGPQIQVSGGALVLLVQEHLDCELADGFPLGQTVKQQRPRTNPLEFKLRLQPQQQWS